MAVNDIVWVHAGPTSGKTTLIKTLRKEGLTVIETDQLFEMLDNYHYNAKVWRDTDVSRGQDYWNWVHHTIVGLCVDIDSKSKSNKWLVADDPRKTTKTVVLTNLWLPVPLTLSVFVNPDDIVKRSDERSKGDNVIPKDIAEKWFVAWQKSDLANKRVLTTEQYLSDFSKEIVEAAVSKEKAVKSVQEKKRPENDLPDEKRKMTDQNKELALKGDRTLQLDWFVEECLEFEAAKDGSEEKLSEAVDVIGCSLKFDIKPDEAKQALDKVKKAYILDKVVMLLSRVTNRAKYYEQLNERQVKRGRKPFNTAGMERSFLQFKNNLK